MGARLSCPGGGGRHTSLHLTDLDGTGENADLAALTEHLDLHDAVHIGHSTGGGEVARYVARYQERVAKAVLVASLTPSMVQTEDNPAGRPREWFDQVQAGVLGNGAEFFRAAT